MHEELEKTINALDITQERRALLHKTITQASEEARLLWYVLLRGKSIEEINSYCELLEARSDAYAGKISPQQMVQKQEDLLITNAQKADLRKKLSL